MAKDKFDFGCNEQASLFDMSGGSTSGSAPEDLSGEGGSIPTPSLQSSLVRAVNACDAEHNEVRVPDHPYSSLCNCKTCEAVRGDKHDSLFGPPEEIQYGIYEAKELRFRKIFEAEARSFIVPRNYLRRWFVGATLCFGAFSPDGHLVGASVLSAPGAHSKRFTAKNSKEVRRFVMLDCCGRNSESKFIAWMMKETKKTCPHLKYVFTFGNPKYDKEAPYKAAGFVFDGTVNCDAQWTSHKSHRAREAAEDKHRYVYTFR